MDILEAYQLYESQSTGLGEQLLLEIETYYLKLSENPRIFKWANKKFRQAAMREFPYVIIYKVVGTEVHIYAVFHTSRNPKKRFTKR